MNVLGRRIPNNLLTYSILKEVKQSSALLSIGCAPWFFPKKSSVKRGRGESNFTVEKPDRPLLSQEIRVTSAAKTHVDCMSPWSEVMKIDLSLCDLPPKTYNPSLIRRKMLDKSRLRDALQSPWAVLLITVKVFKNKEKLRNSHSQEEPEETRRLRCRYSDILGGILEQERDFRWKPRESVQVWALVNNNVLILVH